MLNAILKRIKALPGNRMGTQASKPRIAMLGGRGFHSNYGGVENAVRQISRQIMTRSSTELIVYGTDESEVATSPHDSADVRCVYAPGAVYRMLGQHGATLVCVIHALAVLRPDVVLVFASGPNVFVPLFRLFGIPVVSSLRARDSARDKWGVASRQILRMGEYFAWRFANVFTANSEELIAFYKPRRPDARFIPNGCVAESDEPSSLMTSLGLTSEGYFLFAARFDPVKRLHLLLDAHSRLNESVRLPLVIAGGHSKSAQYLTQLKQYESDKVIFVGHLSAQELSPLMANCRAFLLPSVLEGMSNSLLSAMASGRAVLASDIRPNADVLLNDAALFKKDDVVSLQQGMQRLAMDAAFAQRLGEQLQQHAATTYSWQKTADLFFAEAMRLVQRGHQHV